MSGLSIGDHVKWVGYGVQREGRVKGKVRPGTEDVFLDHGEIVPWQAREIDDCWFAYSGGDTFTFPVQIIEDPT